MAQGQSSGAGRSRFVVDLNPPPQMPAGGGGGGGGRGDYASPGSARKGGCRRVLAVGCSAVVLVAVIALVALFFYWRSYQRSPAYSLALIADAAQRDDRQAFDSLVDAREITRGFLPQVRRQATGSTRELPAAVERQVEAAVERQLPNIEATVREQLRTAIAGAARQAGGEVPFPALVIALRGIASDVREAGDAATLNLQLGGEQPTELSMRRAGERWQLIGVRDSRIAATLAEQLPTALPPTTLPPTALPPPARHTNR